MWFWLALLMFVLKLPFFGFLFLIFWLFSSSRRR